MDFEKKSTWFVLRKVKTRLTVGSFLSYNAYPAVDMMSDDHAV